MCLLKTINAHITFWALSYDFDFEICFRDVSQQGYILGKFFLALWFSMACRCAFWKKLTVWPFDLELWLWNSFPGCKSERIYIREILFGMVIQYGLSMFLLKTKMPVWPFDFELWLWLWNSFPGCDSARIHLREFLFSMVIQYGL